MATLLSIAFRNVRRHPRRTVITAGAVALGVVFMTVAAGFLDYTFWGLRQSIVYGGLGHLQVLPADLDARARLDARVVRELARRLHGVSDVEYVAPRLEFQGLVSAGARTLTFSGIGVDAAAESGLRALTVLTAGRWFSGTERMPRALLGSGLAARLGVRPRDVVSLIGYSDEGSMSAADVQIAGVFESGVIEYDARALLVPIATAHELMATDGLTGLAVTLRDATAIDDVVARVRHWARAAGAHTRVVRWDELSPVYGSVVRLYRWILDVFLIIVTAVVVLGIANTMSMAVFERVAEIGVLRAVGFGASRIVVLFLCEAALIGGFGALAGVVGAVGACIALSAIGIDMPPPPGHSQGYVAQVHIVPEAFAGAVAIAIVSALIAAAGPSLRSVRLEVAQVLRAT